MKYKPTYSIVIPNWNGKKLLEKNLPTVLKAAEKAETIIVDDASTDDSVSFTKKHFPSVKLIEKKNNEGFSAAVNYGVLQASGDIVVLLNTDIEPDKDFIEPLLSHFEDPKVFAVGCLDKSVEKDSIVLRGRGEAVFKKGFYVHRKGEVDKNDTAWVSAGSGAFRKSIWRELGGLDELFNPFYWEDIDISYRALKLGYSIIFESKSVVTHRHEEGAIKSQHHQKKIIRTSYRNQLIFIWKNITDKSFLLSHICFLPYRVVQSIVSGDFVFFMSFIDAVKLLPQIIQKRKRNKKVFILSDQELLKSDFSWN